MTQILSQEALQKVVDDFKQGKPISVTSESPQEIGKVTNVKLSKDGSLLVDIKLDNDDRLCVTLNNSDIQDVTPGNIVQSKIL